MEELLIHIGYHKTGTTWLQKELFVLENEVFEPISRHYPHKSTLGFKFVYGEDGYLLSPFNNNTENINKELLYLLKDKKDCKNKIFVMSNERLCGHYQSGGFDAKAIARRLQNTFPKAKIFISVREQKSYILSQYFQYLTYGGIESLERYMNNKNHKIPTFSPHFHNYNELIKEYYSLFGQDNVLVLPYEMLKLNSKKYIQKLGKFINREIKINEEKFMIKHNTKQHFFTTYYLRKLNLFRFSNSNNNYSNKSNIYTKYISNLFYSIANRLTTHQMNTKLKNKLISYIEAWEANRFIENNKKLSKLINIDLEEYDYY